jgi:predicted DNA-binding helix-hairpin-helix protein
MYVNDDKLFPHIQKNQLESIPIILIDSTERQKELRHMIISQAKNLLRFYDEKSEILMSPRGEQLERKIDYCEDKINELVYALYALSPEEIAIVEGKS